jgi:hypothetical protein
LGHAAQEFKVPAGNIGYLVFKMTGNNLAQFFNRTVQIMQLEGHAFQLGLVVGLQIVRALLQPGKDCVDQGYLAGDVGLQ